MFKKWNNEKGVNLYFHIPFCEEKCGYCYFYSIAKQSNETIEQYLVYLEKEIRIKKKEWKLPNKIKTVYIGGGTPTYLSLPALNKLCNIIFKHFNITHDVEFTMEANPSFCDKNKLKFLKSRGVNRLSFGIQTVDHGILKTIKRTLDLERVKTVIRYARQLKIKTINLDFMYRLPGQNRATLEKDFDFIETIRPTSVYWYETKNVTNLMKSINNNHDSRLNYDKCIESRLSSMGYKRLMTEFYTKEKLPCEYTYDFLLNDFLIGFGPFAISRIRNKFYKNINNLKTYYGLLDQGSLPISNDFQLNKNEYTASHFSYLIRFGVVDLNELEKKFDLKVGLLLRKEIAILKKHSLIGEVDGKIFLTKKGLLFTPSVQIILLNKFQKFLKNLNFFLGRGNALR